MSDRTQGSVQTDDAGAAADPETKAIPTEKPGSSPDAPSASAASGPNGGPAKEKPSGKPAVAPGWGGAAPSGTTQTPAQSPSRPAGQPPAGPTRPAGSTQQPAPKQQPSAKQPAATQQPAKPQQPAAATAATAAKGQPAAARVGAPTTGVRPANRDAAAPRQSSRTPASVRPAETPRTAAADQGERTAVRGATKGGKGPRRARLQLRHIDTWSALKISLVLAIALFCVWMIAVGVLYGVLSGLGVFSTLNELIGQLGSSSGDTAAGEVITPGIVFGGAAVIGAVNIVLFTALCTVGTFVYNLCADLVGGLEVTLAERDS